MKVKQICSQKGMNWINIVGQILCMNNVQCTMSEHNQGPQLEKVFLFPGSRFLRRNFPNIDEEFSLYGGEIFLMNFPNFPNLLNEFS